MNVGDTIVAIASAAGGAGRGIVRISGKDAIHCLANCFRSPMVIPTKAAFRVSGDFHLEPWQRWLPTSVYAWPTNRSYTGQPTVELHAIGSPPLLESMQETICRQSLPDGSRVRLANRGEFTLRAFLAGRLDLPQAEAVLGMIDSTTDRQFNTALVQMAGGVSGPFNSLRSELLDALAELEAGMDFVDEDIQFISNAQLVVTIKRILVETRELQSQLNSRSDAQELPRVVLFGRPNAGKSTLWNLLVQDQAAIVSDTPGTTRDFLASPACIGGVHVLLVDTAGVGETFIDPIDHRAQQVSQENQKQAALKIRCVDAIEFEQPRELELRTESEPHRERTEFNPGTDEIIALTKSDQGPRSIPSSIADDRIVNISSHTGFGIEALKLAIAKQLDVPQNDDSFSIASTASRCRESIRLVVESLSHALVAAENGLGDELIAAELRVALNELATIVGAVYTDDILDRIFSKFCIGK